MNPLLDKKFLLELDEQINKEVYVKLTTLTYNEEPIESIEGAATTGSINIDGDSVVRRTSSLTLVTKELNINQFYWALNNKFKVEVGIRNWFNQQYPDIIWFPQGVYIITSFSTNYTTNGFNVNISGKDKMCLLNGDVGGNLTASIDFGVEEYVDLKNQITYYNKIPIKTIIRESVHTYGKEPYRNIIINDLDETAVELLEYRGDKPLYLLYNINAGVYEQYTADGDMKCQVQQENGSYKDAELATIDINGGSYDTRVELAPEELRGSIILLDDKTEPQYRVAKITHGQTVGFRPTDLTYAGDLISGIGDALTSILDKIVQMLGNYEYFYNLDGQFVFQRKKTYLQTSWNNIKKVGDEEYADSAAHTSSSIYNFTDNKLISSFANSPNLTNLKNDYSIWGNRKSVSGAEIPIHYRYAIDEKPTYYRKVTVNEFDEDLIGHNANYPEMQIKPTKWNKDFAKIYISDQFATSNLDFVDKYKDLKDEDGKPVLVITEWREIIYQMALDYYAYNQLNNFSSRIIEANKDIDDKSFKYLDGTTGYEQYYTDIQGFWRQLYDPEYEEHPTFVLHRDEINNSFYSDTALYNLGKYEKVTDPSKVNRKDVYVLWEDNEGLGLKELQPLLDAYPIEYHNSFVEDENGEIKSNKFFIANNANTMNAITNTQKEWIEKGEIYVLNPEWPEDKEVAQYIPLIDSIPFGDNWYIFKDKKLNTETNLDEDLMVAVKVDIEQELLDLYYNNNNNLYNKYRIRHYLDIEGKVNNNAEPELIKIDYYDKEDLFITEAEATEGTEATVKKYTGYKHWVKAFIDEPTTLNFWFDFLDVNSEMGKYSVSIVGDRTKVINDNNITSIYFREVPNLMFITYEDYKKRGLTHMGGYMPAFIQSDMESLFNISTQGKSAKDELDSLLYNHSYCIENVTIQALPIYYLVPNTRIFISDNESKINGEYIVSKISLPLTYNGMMSITATKAPERLL